MKVSSRRPRPAARSARTALTSAALAVFGLALGASPALAAADPSAGGAATRDVFIATAFMSIPISLLILLMFEYRAGRQRWIGVLSERIGREVRLPAWAAVPSGFVIVGLLLAVFGFYWDVGYHIRNGRDEGPLANPSHYLIMFGLIGIFMAGVLAMCLPKPGEKPSPHAVKITKDWYAPVGGVAIMASAAFAMLGFPLDDVWHRLFGQDVTLWSPTHLLMLSGAVFTLFGQAILLNEGRAAAAADRSMRRRSAGWVSRENKWRRAAACGGLLLGLCVFQAEMDYGVIQFRLVFEPMLIAFTAGLAFVLARIWNGRWGALMALVLYLPLRLAFVFFTHNLMDNLPSHFPIFIVEALLVEIAAGFVSTRKPLRFATLAGLLIGTVGVAAEWGWSHVYGYYGWNANMLGQMILFAPAMALFGAWIGAWIGQNLAHRGPAKGGLRYLAPVALVGTMLVIGWNLHEPVPRGLTAAVTTTTAKVDKPGRWFNATVRVSDPSITKHPIWLKQIAWQGHGFELADLKQTAPGVLQTTKPMPAFGKWKSGVRIQTTDGLLGVQLYAPADSAIPLPALPALAHMTRPIEPDRKLLQRESKIKAGPLATSAYSLLFLIALVLIAIQAWGIGRVGGRELAETDADPSGERRESPGAATGPAPSPA